MATAPLAGSRDAPLALRPPEVVMRLERMGSFHQTRISFMRSLLRRIASEGWRLSRPRFELDAEGYGTDSKGIKGKGVLHLAEGRLPSSPALAGVEKALGRGTSLVGASYLATEAPFHVENNRLTLEGFQLETPQAALDLKGTVDLDGPLALSLVLRTPREGLVIHEVPAEVLDALADDEGWIAVPLQITGTREEPRVTPDAKALLAQAKKSTGKLIQEGVKSFFQRTFN